jgi:hypothetical protein
MPSLTFVDMTKDRPLVGKGAPLGQVKATNIRLGKKSSERQGHWIIFRSINDEEKSFYDIVTWAQCCKTFCARNLRTSTIS